MCGKHNKLTEITGNLHTVQTCKLCKHYIHKTIVTGYNYNYNTAQLLGLSSEFSAIALSIYWCICANHA